MTWLLLMVVLEITPNDAFVKHSEVIKTFHSEQACIKDMQQIFKDAEAQGNKVPSIVNFGCVPLKGRSI
jgi:hypothetical protein|tara:strand:+ start:347 stop:553 length:207 start_codon:yes stop_codon:yes gene_type:complete